MDKFSEILRKLRKEYKLSQAFIASCVDVTQQCVSEWEQGKIEPTLSKLCKLADIFGVSIDFLAGRKDY